jgi:hypothetical protein
VREPALFVPGEVDGGGAAGEADDEVVAEAEQVVVPAVGEQGERSVGKVGVLIGEEGVDEVRANVELSGGHAVGHRARVPGEQRPRTLYGWWGREVFHAFVLAGTTWHFRRSRP